MSLGCVSCRRSIERTVDGHHCVPPCAVGTSSASSSRAMAAKLRPAAWRSRIRSTTSPGTETGRPRAPFGCGCARGGRRRSATNRCSSSTGISRVPHGISTVSINDRNRRLNVERLTPSASAACVRVYVSRSTRVASRTISAGGRAGVASACRRIFSLRRFRRRRDTHTIYTNGDLNLHHDASVSAPAIEPSAGRHERD